jgi:hypothetical protein
MSLTFETKDLPVAMKAQNVDLINVNTCSLILDKINSKPTIMAFRDREVRNKEDIFRLLAEEVNELVKFTKFSHDPHSGEVTMNLSSVAAIGFFKEYDEQTGASIIREFFERDWDSVQMVPLSTGIDSGIMVRLTSGHMVYPDTDR